MTIEDRAIAIACQADVYFACGDRELNKKLFKHVLMQHFEDMGLMNDAELTLEEQATNYITMKHIERVRNLLNQFAKDLLERGEKHDQSKLEQPESVRPMKLL